MGERVTLKQMEPANDWDRMPQESNKAFHAFQCYLNLERAERSAVAAYRKFTGNMLAKKPTSIFVHWMADHEWRERVARHDAHLLQIERQAREKAHVAELEAFRGRQKNLSAALLNGAVGLLQKTNERLKTLKPEDIPDKSLPAFFRACAAVAEAATNGEASSLAVEQLIHTLQQEE